MGKRIVVLGADYSANGIAQSNPAEVAYFSIYPQEIENGVTFQSGLGTFIGPCVPSLQEGQMTTILSSIDKKGVVVSVGVIDPISATIVAAYYNIELTGYETDVRNLNIIMPKGHYVGYTNIYTGLDMYAPSAFDFTTDFGTNHFECNGRNVGDSVNLAKYATLGITLGYRMEVAQYTTSIQEISPSLESGGQAFIGDLAIGPVIGAENDGIMTKVLSSLDKASTPIILAIVNPDGKIVSTYKFNLTGYETDVRGYNIIVPKGHYVGYANVTGGSSIFNFESSGLPHFESTTLAVGSSVKLNQFAGLSITLGCQIELISPSSN